MGYTVSSRSTSGGSATKKKSPMRAGAAVGTHRPHQQQVTHRLRRVEGQIRGVLAMIEEQKSCSAIAQQLSAARKALDRAFYEMMACSLEMDVINAPNNAALCARIAENTRLLAKYA